MRLSPRAQGRSARASITLGLSLCCAMIAHTSLAMPSDPHSAARPTEVAVKHLHLDLKVDFPAKRLLGRASLTLDRQDPQAALWLDTRDLEINRVTYGDGAKGPFKLGEDRPFLGRALEIPLPAGVSVVHIDYRTSPQAAALQWLEPAQTAGKKHPFLLSQSQAILARTWVPCQDTPAVRMTYSARIEAPKELLAVMSASNPVARTADGVYTFDMPQPIPSYLLALSVGDLEFRSLGKRVGVYAEPSMIERSAYEFAETEAMIDAVEKLYGPYRWGRYDLLVLPPSFPFGGMENPRLTFATPTILAGDRSLVSLIAHELAHSWSGNLVTNANWNDFWLNEGFTVYVERRIMEELSGKDYADMLAILGRQDLDQTVADIGPTSADTHLELKLEGRDPDDGMTEIAYEKGALFLTTIEKAVGRERFDPFLRAHFDDNAFKTLTTKAFLERLESGLIKGDAALRAQLQIEAWVNGPGIPANAPTIKSTRFEQVDNLLAAWSEGKTPTAELKVDSWSTHEWLRFLRGLPEKMTAAQMAELDGRFGFSKTGNSEKLHAWLHHVIANRYAPAYPALRQFLTGMGRRKFLRPLYERMAAKTDLKAMALEIYKEARPGYHSVAVGSIDPIVGYSDK